jgi:hypothetical protein
MEYIRKIEGKSIIASLKFDLKAINNSGLSETLMKIIIDINTIIEQQSGSDLVLAKSVKDYLDDIPDGCCVNKKQVALKEALYATLFYHHPCLISEEEKARRYNNESKQLRYELLLARNQTSLLESLLKTARQHIKTLERERQISGERYLQSQKSLLLAQNKTGLRVGLLETDNLQVMLVAADQQITKLNLKLSEEIGLNNMLKVQLDRKKQLIQELKAKLRQAGQDNEGGACFPSPPQPM